VRILLVMPSPYNGRGHATETRELAEVC